MTAPQHAAPGALGATAPSPLLEIEDLSVTIGATAILEAVSLTLEKGEILALCGESGSGKSMTAQAVMGLLPGKAVQTGTIRFDGAPIDTQDEARMTAMRGARLGMIFQEPMTALNPVQTIGDQVSETIRIHDPTIGRAEAKARAAATLARVGLPPDRVSPSRYPHELSGGQRQRVGIAIATALTPDLLIADEPTTALDVTTQARILDLITRLVREDGLSCLFITHDLAVVSGLADRVAIMNNGTIVETGTARAVLGAPGHPYSRALIKASAHRPTLPTPAPGAPVLQADAVTRTYPLPRRSPFATRRHHTAVDRVSLTIGAGERVGLVGESGCGKSTLTRALLGLDPAQGGTIRLGGEPIGPDAGHAIRRRVQVVFQDPYSSFNPRHPVHRLLTEPFHLLPDPPQGAARTAAVTEALEAVGLPADAAERYIHAFSGGQRQRLAIARALIVKPDLIVFDEAVSALDVRVRAQILDMIAGLSTSRGLGYLFISHDLTVVRGITDRVLVMKDGQIVEEGATASVLDAPRHAYTQALVAAAPRLATFEEQPA